MTASRLLSRRWISAGCIIYNAPNRVSRATNCCAVWGPERFVHAARRGFLNAGLRACEKKSTDADHPAFLKTVRVAGYCSKTLGNPRIGLDFSFA